MSLFELKQLWSVTLPGEEFDGRHLAVGLLDSDTEPRLALASFAGMLRIYRPSKKYSERDLLYEGNFNEPIVQLHVGTFLATIGRSLGVLFARRLTILAFASATGERGLISKSYEIPLSSPCFAFIENPLLAASLNSELLYLSPPSKLQLKVGQPIYAINHSVKSNCLYYMDGQELVMVNASTEQWRVVLGDCQHIHVYTPNYTDEVVCVGTNCYWVVDDNSTIVESKHIENEVACSVLVEVPNGGGYNVLLGTFSQHVFIYNKGKLLWAAKCHAVPIAIHTVEVEGRRGFLSLLFEGGELEVSYLGTEAPVKETADATASLDFKEIEKDIQRLEAVVAQTREQKGSASHNKKHNDLRLTVRKAYPSWSEEYVEDRQRLFTSGSKVRVLNVDLTLGKGTANEDIEVSRVTNVKLQFDLPSNLHMPEPVITFEELADRSTDVAVQLFVLNNKFPYVESFNITATYLTDSSGGRSGEPRLTTATVALPFSFQCVRSQSKVEKAQHKIILIASQEIPKYTEFYRELEWQGAEAGSSLTFSLACGAEVSVVASKNSAKYKIQSDYYEGLCLVLLDFISRCTRLRIELSIESVPLEELFLITENHFKARKKLQGLNKKLEECSGEFRQVQKRILAKTKERAGELNSLDFILADSHRSLIQCCNDFEQAQEELAAVNHQLLISIRIVCELLFLRGKTSEQARRTIYGVLNVQQQQATAEGWGWQEQLIVNSSVLLRKKVTAQDIEQLDYEKVRKTLLWLVDRTAKGEIN